MAAAAVYLPILATLWLDRHHYGQLSDLVYFPLMPGFAPLAALAFSTDLIPGNLPQWSYHAAGAILTLLFLIGLTLLGARSRAWQSAAIALGLGIGGFAAYMSWAMLRME